MSVSPYVHMLPWTGICTYINKQASGLYVCMYGRMICVFVETRKYMCVNCSFYIWKLEIMWTVL